MTSSWRVRWLPALVFLVAQAAPLHAQSFGFAWWRDAQFQRDLTLSADQAARIEAVFQAAITQLRQKKQDLDQQEEELSRMISSNADEALVTRQVDKVETTRAAMNKMRTLMLLHERQLLTPEQRAKLNKLHEQWERDHKVPPRGRN
jgi:Spy/CpxP family protein refolding chaperone